MSKEIDINKYKGKKIKCKNCHWESVLKEVPIYENFELIRQDVSCAMCGYIFKDEKEIAVLDKKEREVLDKKTENIFCKDCENLRVDLWEQKCYLTKKFVESFYTCNKFKPR
jgi:hypothetical protein